MEIVRNRQTHDLPLRGVIGIHTSPELSRNGEVLIFIMFSRPALLESGAMCYSDLWD